MKQPKADRVFVVFCENGEPCLEDEGGAAVFDHIPDAQEFVEFLGQSGCDFDCKKHRIFEYVLGQEIK